MYQLWQEHCCCDSRLSILCDMVSKISASDLSALTVDGRCGGGDDIRGHSKDAKLCHCMQVVKNICTVNGKC